MENKIGYNVELIDTQYALINSFLIKADKNILDISYTINGNEMVIQVVLLEGCNLSHERIEMLKQNLNNFNLTITELHITKVLFNENKGEWMPKYYKWLDYLLFSKAEVL